MICVFRILPDTHSLPVPNYTRVNYARGQPTSLYITYCQLPMNCTLTVDWQYATHCNGAGSRTTWYVYKHIHVLECLFNANFSLLFISVVLLYAFILIYAAATSCRKEHMQNHGANEQHSIALLNCQ